MKNNCEEFKKSYIKMYHLNTKRTNKFYLYIFLLCHLIYPNLSRNVGPQVDPGKNDDKNSVLMHVI